MSPLSFIPNRRARCTVFKHACNSWLVDKAKKHEKTHKTNYFFVFLSGFEILRNAQRLESNKQRTFFYCFFIVFCCFVCFVCFICFLCTLYQQAKFDPNLVLLQFQTNKLAHKKHDQISSCRKPVNMHHELTLFQEITDTIGHESGVESTTSNPFNNKLVSAFHYSFLCGASLFFLATVDNDIGMTQFELDLSKWEWQRPKTADVDLVGGVYVDALWCCVCSRFENILKKHCHFGFFCCCHTHSYHPILLSRSASGITLHLPPVVSMYLCTEVPIRCSLIV